MITAIIFISLLGLYGFIRRKRTEFTQSYEEKVRKQWLISFVIMTLISQLSFFLDCVEKGLLGAISMETGFAFGVFICILFSVLISLPWFLITFRCSYRNKGTAWLKWIMISIPVRVLFEFWKEGLNDLPDLILNLFASGIDIYFWMLCLSLHQVNSARKRIRLSPQGGSPTVQ